MASEHGPAGVYPACRPCSVAIGAQALRALTRPYGPCSKEPGPVNRAITGPSKGTRAIQGLYRP